MKPAQFNDFLQVKLNIIKTMLTSKSKEYASDSDQLHSFKAASKRLNCSPERALMGYLDKHIGCIVDMIDDIENNRFKRDKKYVSEKLTDFQNYGILLEALLNERVENNGMQVELIEALEDRYIDFSQTTDDLATNTKNFDDFVALNFYQITPGLWKKRISKGYEDLKNYSYADLKNEYATNYI